MRIIAGFVKGHPIKPVPGKKTRPTADRVKEAIFSVLAYRVSGARCLDLFAGTGNLGLEAISRGASYVLWVDESAAAVKTMKENINNLNIAYGGQVWKKDALRALVELKTQGAPFDLIFLDPPYHSGLVYRALDLIDRYRLLADNGTIVVEDAVGEALPVIVGNLEQRQLNRYGDTQIGYYQLREEAEEVSE